MNTKLFAKAIADIVKHGKDSIYKIQHSGNDLYIFYDGIAVYRINNTLGLVINNPDCITFTNLDLIMNAHDLVEVKPTDFTKSDSTEFETTLKNKRYFKTKLLKLLDFKLKDYYYEYSEQKNLLYIYDSPEKDIFVACICEVLYK